MPSMTTFAPAKINLGLQIGKHNANGLHELSSFMYTIDLQDQLSIEARKATKLAPRLDLSVEEADLSTGSDNLVYQAAQLWQQASGLELDLKIKLIKRIPQGAGLGGASSDAASTLLALNRLFPEAALATEDLLPLAKRLGSDVPFFLRPGLALVSGSGEKILHLESLPQLTLLLVKPNFSLSTGKVFAALDKTRSESECMYNEPFTRDDLSALKANPELCYGRLKNDFTGLLSQQYPPLAVLLSSLEASQACFASLSGSGPTCYAVFKEEATRDQTLAALRTQFPDYWFCATYTLS